MRKFRFKTLLILLLFFATTQALGIYVAFSVTHSPSVGAIQPEIIVEYNLSDLAIILVSATLFILIVIKFRTTGAWIFRVVVSILILGGFQTVFDLFMPSVLAFIVGVLAVVLFHFYNNLVVQNTVMIISLAGLGALLGLSLTPMMVVVAMAVLSMYDIWAVYKTKHMVALAEVMIASRAISGFVLPDSQGKTFTSKIDQLKPGSGFMLLGSGDIVMPILLSAALVPISLTQAIIVAIFATGGIFVMYSLLTTQEEPKPMAALPPIAAMSIVGYLISLM